MNNALILCDIHNSVRSTARCRAMSSLLGFLGFRCVVVDRSALDQELVSSLNTQAGVREAEQAAYITQVGTSLAWISKGDVVIASEPWHKDCFKGLLSVEGGTINKAPVIELWVDYPDSFAEWKVFSSQYVAGASMQGVVNPERYIVARPYIEPKHQDSLEYSKDLSSINPFSTDFLYLSAKGVPVVAPDFGVFREHISHGITGLRYRTPEGKAKALEQSNLLPSKAIIEYVRNNYSLCEATEEVAGFITRAVNGKTSN